MRSDLLTYRSTSTRILWHGVFWMALVAYNTLIFGAYSGGFGRELVWEAVALPAKMGATYATLYLLLPRFFMRRRFVRFAVWVTSAVLAAALFQRLFELAAVREFSNPYERADVLLHPIKVFRAALGIYPVVALAAFIKLAKVWLRRERQSETLEREKLQAELNYLKAQIRPHFLLNTLNNLYALTLRKSDRAQDVILKLSDMLGYLLYEGSAAEVPLENEIAAIQTYLELEKLRCGERLDATLEVEGDTGGRQIPPMLLLPFVENAFKHGISRLPDGGWICIKIKVCEADFRFMVQNSVENQAAPDAPPSVLHSAPSSKASSPRGTTLRDGRAGIGLSNMRRRLELLYGDRYRLEITPGVSTFTVELILPLERERLLKPEPETVSP